jgi:RadC-like JAB domain
VLPVDFPGPKEFYFTDKGLEKWQLQVFVGPPIARPGLRQTPSAIIPVHNHPSDDPTPSQADIAMTQEIVSVARPLGISVHDHLIVGKDGHASFKGLRLI